MDRPKVAVVGAGALGTALAHALGRVDYPLAAVVSRRADRAQALAASVGASVGGAVAELPAEAALVVCCVPDDALAGLARTLAADGTGWQDRVVLHTSGALTAGVLAPVAEAGAAVGSWHPLQTFAASTDGEAFASIYVALEGDKPAVEAGQRLARALGARTLTLAPEAKVRYHLAASMASNYLVTLLALVGEVLGDVGIGRQEAAALVRPLVDGTWRNLATLLPEDALTGPVVRGDAETVAGHLDALRAHLPHLIPVYAALGAETVRLGVRSGRLIDGDAQRLLDVLHAALDAGRDPPM